MELFRIIKNKLKEFLQKFQIMKKKDRVLKKIYFYRNFKL